MANSEPRFSLGRTLITPAALSACEGAGANALTYLTRHHHGDWGEGLPEEDRKLNEQALENGNRLLSSYLLSNGTKLWIITEAEDDDGNRVATTILLPSDY